MKHVTEEKMFAQVGLPLSSLIPFRTALFSTFQGEGIRKIRVKRQEWEETNLTKQNCPQYHPEGTTLQMSPLSPNLLDFVHTSPSKLSSVYTVLSMQLKFSSLYFLLTKRIPHDFVFQDQEALCVSLWQVTRSAKCYSVPRAGMGLTFLEPQNYCQEDIE